MKKRINVFENVLKVNDYIAQENLEFFKKRKIKCYNIIGSPGSGKTTLISLIKNKLKLKNCLAIVGDLFTSTDANMLKKNKVDAIQINTLGACHLDANMVKQVIEKYNKKFKKGILFIENVGNLVCPSSFYLGEHKRIVVLSVAEGYDKIKKYKTTFKKADIVFITKMDMIKLTNFDIKKAEKDLKKINPKVKIYLTSIKDNLIMPEFNI